ncbi:hypothetical protein BKA80DRAFT_111820 [Phyllosticta citrichinensis]
MRRGCLYIDTSQRSRRRTRSIRRAWTATTHTERLHINEAIPATAFAPRPDCPELDMEHPRTSFPPVMRLPSGQSCFLPTPPRPPGVALGSAP